MFQFSDVSPPNALTLDDLSPGDYFIYNVDGVYMGTAAPATDASGSKLCVRVDEAYSLHDIGNSTGVRKLRV